MLDYLALPEERREAIDRRARELVLCKDTAAHRARELERHVAALTRTGAGLDVSEAGILAKPSP